MEENKEKNLNHKFDELCQKTYDDLRKIMNAKIKDRYITDEVLQNTYLTASKKKKELLSHPEPKGWLYQTAMYCYLNLYKMIITIQNYEKEFNENMMVKTDESDGYKDIAEDLLFSLPETDKELMEEVFYNNLKLTEIAEKQNIPYSRLQRRFHRLLEKKRKPKK